MSWIKVLVAGSDSKKRGALVDILMESGLEPMVASDFEEVRSILVREQLHVIFCENNLPGGGFREIIRLATEMGSLVEVVVSSMLGELDEYLEAMKLGAFDFVAPPYRGADIISIVDNACQHYLRRRKNNKALFYLPSETDIRPRGIA
jgi:DNA-binding NtrC family response regulator